MLHIILADSELETIPDEISKETPIQKEAEEIGKNPTDLILDSNYHHDSMEKLDESERRGRPDIIQACTMAALESPLNKENLLRFYIHTRHDKIIEMETHTRIPRSYNRFIGLMEQLFKTGEVPPNNPLITLSEKSLETKINEIDPDKTISFSIQGGEIKGSDIFSPEEKEKDICVLIGGFPKGEFNSNIEKLSDKIIKMYDKPLNALTVINHAIQFYEESCLDKKFFE